MTPGEITGEEADAGYTPSDPGQEMAPEEDGTIPDASNLAFRTRTVERAGRKSRSWPRSLTILLACGYLAIGAVAGYLLSRRSQEPANVGVRAEVPKAVRLLTPADEEELDAAYTARLKRSFAEAEQRFTALERKHPDWPTLEIEAGRTLLFARKYDAAHSALNNASNQEGLALDANLLLACTYSAQKAYQQAELNFDKAAALDPTRAETYFLWGECLRLEGKPLAAAAKFHSALLRNEYETSAGLYRLKWWLSEIEADQENSSGVSAEIDAGLKQPRPSMEVFFAAAARDLKAGDLRTAATRILRGRRRVDATMLYITMNDPIFAQARLQPEFMGVFLSAVPAAGVPTGTPSLPASGPNLPATPAVPPAKSE